MEDHHKYLTRFFNNINIILSLIILCNMWYFYVLSKSYEANIAKIMEKTAVIEEKATVIEKELVVGTKPIRPPTKDIRDAEDLRDYIVTQFPKVLEKDIDIIATEISKQCIKHGISFSLIAGLIDVESSYNKFAKSNKDSHGLMQIRYKVWGPKLGIKQRKDLYRIKVNINLGVGILKYYIDQNGGNITKALQDYSGTCNRDFSNRVHKAAKRFVEFRSAYDNNIVKSTMNEEDICIIKSPKQNTAKVKMNGPSKHRKQSGPELGKRKRLPSSTIVQRKHKTIHKQRALSYSNSKHLRLHAVGSNSKI